MKDPMNPASTPQTENNGDSSPDQGSTPQVVPDTADSAASQADQAQPTGTPEAATNGQDNQAEPSLSPDTSSANSKPERRAEKDLDASKESEPAGSDAKEKAEEPDENAAFVDLAARLGEEIADAPAPAEGENAVPAATEADLEPTSELDQLKAQVAELTEQLARARAETYNLQQEYSGYVKRSKSDMSAHHSEGQKAVLQVLLGVLDDVQAARDAGDLKGPFEAIAKKLENTLETNFGLTRYGSIGEEFDPNVHEALMAQSGGEGEPSIAQVLQPGYKVGENVLRATKVIVNNPD